MSTENSEVAEPLRAVAYVRMSTDRQIYSTENQMEAIAAYAARRNITIVRIYKDGGKSGLLPDRRPALKSLLGDVMLGKADFECILVHDVSRGGRFQNSDESALTSSSAKRPAYGSNIAPRSFQTTAAFSRTR
jgi:DNA invertase Pin-like site-specific DNA recombinase